jgi:hypothetical protein
MGVVGEKTVRRVFDAFRATGWDELDITDRSYLDWHAWIQTSFSSSRDGIHGDGIKKAVLKYNKGVRDTSRPGLWHGPWLPGRLERQAFQPNSPNSFHRL